MNKTSWYVHSNRKEIILYLKLKLMFQVIGGLLNNYEYIRSTRRFTHNIMGYKGASINYVTR